MSSTAAGTAIRTPATSARIHHGPVASPPTDPVPLLALRHARDDPAAVAVVDGATGETLTRGELAARSAALAAGLRARGVGRGDLVALDAPNLAWWPVVALGAWRAGAAIALLSPLWTAEEAARVLEHARPRLGVAFGPLAPVLRAALPPDAELVVLGGPGGEGTPIAELLAADAGEAPAAPATDAGDLAAVPFSSGTGGLPKGVRLTHGNLAAAAATAVEGVAAGGPLDARATVLACAPFFHSMGLSLSLTAPLTVGAPIVTLPRPELEPLLRLIAAHRVTHVAVPPQLVHALAFDPSVDRHDLSSLCTVATGGTHVPAEVERRASARLGCVVRQGYGITEATCIVSSPQRRPSTEGTAGWLAAGMEARLVDPATGADVPEGEPGELWLRGPQVMDGYHGLPQATAAVLEDDGWLRTGDLVAIRPDGQLEVRDRLKELVKVGGSSVAPAELELVLREHPAVRDAAVVGRPDDELGEVPVGFVALAAPAEPAELQAFVAARVAGPKRLRAVVVLDEIPRLPTGKLLRRALRERAAQTG
jgi:acyl-CoA synthetase (AMP-forming)/AMP-acid ligase II